MPTPKLPPDRQKLSSIIWSTNMVVALLQGLCDQVQLGRGADGEFRREAWEAVLPQIQALIIQTDEAGNPRILTQTQASNKKSELKTM